jgi:N-acetyl-1-D-myo-inositol-2-amino-2-deoxy-alpha-D-glucopyranoside deacetylase
MTMDTARRPLRLLVTVAHPDDETFGLGSVLAHATGHGVEARVICATRGELGEPAIDIGSTPLAEVREGELRAAASILGVTDVELLDYRDSGVDGDPEPGSLVAADTHDVAAVLAARIDALQPDVVITADGSDGHRDHVAIRDATLAGLRIAGWRPARTYLWCLPRSLLTAFAPFSEMGTPDDAITTVVDATSYIPLRWQAMRAHASQTPPYDLMSPELQHAFLCADHFIRVDPPFSGEQIERDWIPDDRRR